MSFIAELKRRNVFKVGAAYAIVAWLIAQIIVVVETPLNLPDWVDTLVIVLLIIGFPVALIITWAFELTPEGIKKSQSDDEPSGEKTTPTTENTEQSIAVLPFDNMSSDPEQEHFSDGISEEILNYLARIPDLQVRGRTSSFYFKGRNEDLRTISEMLKVEHLIEGSVRKSGNQVRITVQLINARTDTHLWSKTYDRNLEDIFAIQEDIAKSVADALEVTLGVGALGTIQGMTHNMAAYEAYLSGRSQSRYIQREAYLNAIEHLEKAVSLDPGFGLAWGALASVYYLAQNLVIPDRAEEYLEKMEQAAARAIALAPETVTALTAVAVLQVRRREWISAEENFKKALALAPADYTLNTNYGLFLQSVRRLKESIKYFEQADRSEPLNVLPTQNIALAYDMMGEFDKAMKKFEVVKQKKIGNIAMQDALIFVIAMAMDDRDLLNAYFEKTIEVDKVFLPLSNHSLNPTMRDLLDKPEAAREALYRFAEDPDYQNAFIRSNVMAMWACYFGDPDFALKLQYKGDRPSIEVVYTLWRSVFRPMRQLPGFKKLLHDIGVVDYWRTTGHWGDFCRPVGDDDFECI